MMIKLSMVGSSFRFFVAGDIYVKRLASRSPVMQVLPFRWNRMRLHRLTVCNHALAFGYSLATMIVYQISLIFERKPGDNSNNKTDKIDDGGESQGTFLKELRRKNLRMVALL